MKIALAVFAALVFSLPAQAKAPERAAPASPDQAARQEGLKADMQAVMRYREGLRSVMVYVSSRTDIFSSREQDHGRLMTRPERELVWQTWKTFLDYLIALDAIEERTQGLRALQADSKRDSFLVSYAAFLARYRFSMEWISAMGRNPEFDTLLNEPVPELGLPRRTYAKLKLKVLNVVRATQFAALEAIDKSFGSRDFPEARAGIKEDSSYIWKAGRFQGHALTVKNAFDVFKGAGFAAWFPVQTEVSEWMGDTKVYRIHESLITKDQVKDMIPRLQPGDILLIRHEWFVSNVGLPGFWPHAALYIGTPAEREAYFDDPAVKAWVRGQGQADGDFDSLLRAKYPQSYALSVQKDKDREPRILEAISEGVSFTALDHALDADSAVVLRPRLSKKEKAMAIRKGYHYAGRPYDFNFDFLTDSSLVCTELVYKSYEPSPDTKGLKWPLTELMGRKLLPANEIARQFAEQYGKPDQQLDFVMLLDGYEKDRLAKEGTLQDFLASWKRPKWHVLVQGHAR